jgi:hypothetical protein
MYFVNEEMELLAKAQAAAQKRSRNLSLSFSSMGALMPGRKPAAKGKKRSAKPAAKSKSA